MSRPSPVPSSTRSPSPSVPRDAHSERSPLLQQHRPLPERSDSSCTDSKTLTDATTPLPWKHLAILGLLRLSEPVCFYVVFPFIPAMIRELGIVNSDEEIGYRAGLIESAFSVTQFATIFFWSSLSDSIGRKPVLLLGALGSAISVLSISTSTTFLGLILSRCICGCFSGSTGVMKAAIGEITDPSNRARALTLSPLMAGVGASVGPMIGAIKFKPETVSQFPFLQRHPYLAPCGIAAMVPLASLIVAALFLPETLQKPEKSGSDGSEEAVKGPRPLKELMNRQLVTIFANYSLLVFVGTAFLAITPVLCFTRPEQGGLGFAPTATGSLLAFRGVMTILIQTIGFPPLERRFGAARLFRVATSGFPFIFFSAPFLIKLAQKGHVTEAVIGFGLDMILWATGNIAYSCGTMLVVSAATSNQELGTLNGIVQSSAAGVRAFAPASATTLFALSVDKHWLGGQLWWIALGLVSCCLIPSTSFLRDGPKPEKSKPKDRSQV